ncbi:MAG: hypothetical protein H0V54_10040 [Chthoniobacterales bacterium]|nr:hypothetical protein [Chthoniobacterales bacterium]
MKFSQAEIASERREERGKARQVGGGVHWADPSAWVPPLVVGLLMALLVRMWGINMPLHDDFDSPGKLFLDWVQGNFGWHSLWVQHNESRLVVPRLIWLVEACTVGWSTKHWMYATVVMCAAEVYLLGLLLQKLVRHTALRWAVACCTSLLLLHPRLAPETFLRGSQGIALVASVLIVLGLFLYSRPISYPRKLLIYVILAEIGTLTFASGMIVWVLLFPIFPLLCAMRDPAVDGRSVFIPTALACLCAVFSIGSYFVDFRGVPITWPENGLAGLLTYFFSWIGAGLATIGDSRAALAFGVGLFGAAAGCIAMAMVRAIKDRSLAFLEGAWPWLALLVYVIVSGAVNALTRSSLGIGNALAERYTLFTMQMTVGLAGLAAILACSFANGSGRSYQKTRLVVASLLLLSGIFYALAGWQRGITRCHRHHLVLVQRQLALSLWREAPSILPLPMSAAEPPPRRRTQYLSLVDAGLSPDYSGGLWLTKALKEAKDLQPVGEVRVRGEGEKLNASGWAMKPVTRTPFPAVLAVVEEPDSKLTPIWIDLMRKPGPPLPGRLDTDESSFLMGFTIYPLKGRPTIAPADRLLFFALDPKHHEAYPIQRVR